MGKRPMEKKPMGELKKGRNHVKKCQKIERGGAKK